MDLAFLGGGLASGKSRRPRVTLATAAVLGVTVLDILTGRELVRDAREQTRPAGGSAQAGGGIHVEQSITVGRPPEEIYRFWRDFENLPRFMEHLESVKVLDDRRSHWRARAPAGSSVEWDAEIVEDRPNQRISVAIASERRGPEYRHRSVHAGAWRSRHRGPRRAAVRAARRHAGLAGRKALRRGARSAGQERLAPPQASDRDRRGGAFGCQHAPRDAPGPAFRLTRHQRSRTMKANCWMGKKRLRGRGGAGPQDPELATTRSSASRRRRSAAPTCTSTTASSRRWRRATSSATSSWARSSRSAGP